MKHLMNTAVLRENAVDALRAIATIPRRRYFWLLCFAVAGYAYGYQDAFRGPESLGWRFADLVDRVTPASIHEVRRQNAEALRQRVRDGLEIP